MTKKTKKILWSTFGSLAAVATFSAIAASCKPAINSKQSNVQVDAKYINRLLNKQMEDEGEIVSVYNTWWNSPIAQLRNTAKQLDEAIDLSKSTTFAPLIKEGKYAATFSAQAEKLIAALKKDIKMYADSAFWKGLRDAKTTVLVGVNFGGENGLTTLSSEWANNYAIFQPSTFPLLYAKPTNAELPGLGMYFPVPNTSNESAFNLLDPWFSYGDTIAEGSDAAARNSLPQKIDQAFMKTADKVVYMWYDAGYKDGYTVSGTTYTRDTAKMETFANTIAGYSDFTAPRLLKTAANRDNNFFITPMSDTWYSNYGLIGLLNNLDKLSRAFGMDKTTADALKSKSELMKIWKEVPPMSLYNESDKVMVSEGKYKLNDNAKGVFKKYMRENNTDIKIWATSSQSLDQLFALSLKPDLTVSSNLSTSGHETYQGALHLIDWKEKYLKNVTELTGDNVFSTKNLPEIEKLGVNIIIRGRHAHAADKSGEVSDQAKVFSKVVETSRAFNSATRYEPTNDLDTPKNVWTIDLETIKNAK
ncbi:hypothetical protein OF377_02505 [Ureaplasma sp. ES3154-GEN]|uniref:Vmc-like lipoprotein signal peptide domain-containing protein n=1 Tax=Ureaplasma sp. ES3154-GEN TaxID=2984844 RepID=UPI0021E8371E|nr:hypothetical protein [Ureaplasma sp. ES3154-GEN]MCV3743735.1 hypothetical protein [Ureaplasma sp. ES3154-GEN]